jgi:aarF domain-containing kinase
LAALTVDTDELKKLPTRAGPDVPSTLLNNVAQMAAGIPLLFNTLNVRRAIIPAANGHCSARALARYYAALATGGSIPPPHSANSKPPLGSHVHAPKFPTAAPKKKKSAAKKGRSSTQGVQDASLSDKDGYSQLRTSDVDGEAAPAGGVSDSRLFSNDKILDAFMGVGEYESMAHPDGKFGLGFRRYNNSSGKLKCFGHSGMGGSTGYCDVENNFAIAVMVNKMSLGSVTRGIVRLVCEELGLPVPDEFSAAGEKGPDMVLNLAPSQQQR